MLESEVVGSQPPGQARRAAHLEKKARPGIPSQGHPEPGSWGWRADALQDPSGTLEISLRILDSFALLDVTFPLPSSAQIVLCLDRLRLLFPVP